MTKLNPSFSRRNLLLGTLQGAGFFLLSGCDKIFDALSRNDKFQSLLELAEHGNRRAQRLLTGRNKLAQEFSAKDISPKFRSNGNPPPITMDYAADAKNQWTKWRLEVSGLVTAAGQLLPHRAQKHAFAHADYAPRLRRRLERDRQVERRAPGRDDEQSSAGGRKPNMSSFAAWTPIATAPTIMKASI